MESPALSRLPGKRIMVLPVSGGSFPAQIAMVRQLLLSGIHKYDILLGTSGGNVVGYLTIAMGFDPHRLYDSYKLFNGNMFVTPWSDIIPTSVIGYFNGSNYKASDKGLDMFIQLFRDNNIKSVEMWSSTMERKTGRAQLWCNMGKSEASIKELDLSVHSNCKTLRYIEGDNELLAKVCLASASIPSMVEPQLLQGELHQDGGTVFSSPLSPLAQTILNMNVGKPVHMDYISCCDTEMDNVNNGGNIIKSSEATFRQLMASHRVSDRAVATRMAYRNVPGYKTVVSTGVGSIQRLREIERERADPTVVFSLLELYPTELLEVNIIHMKDEDVKNMIDACTANYRYRLWVCRKSS